MIPISWNDAAALAGAAMGIAVAVGIRGRFGGGPRQTPPGPEVPRVQNRWPSVEAYAAELRAAYEAAGLRGEAAILATTHSMLATGAWGPRGPTVFNFNVGVIRANAHWRGAWCRAGTVEVTDDRGTVDPGDDVRVRQPAQAWRAYGSLEWSARDTLRLWQGSRYRSAYELLLAGDPGFSRRLGELGWYTANPEFFERVFRNRLGRVRRIFGEGT